MIYHGVSNPSTLEKQLDNIWIGNMKIHVNQPKYQCTNDVPLTERRMPIEKGDCKGKKSLSSNKVWKRKIVQIHA